MHTSIFTHELTKSHSHSYIGTDSRRMDFASEYMKLTMESVSIPLHFILFGRVFFRSFFVRLFLFCYFRSCSSIQFVRSYDIYPVLLVLYMLIYGLLFCYRNKTNGWCVVRTWTVYIFENSYVLFLTSSNGQHTFNQILLIVFEMFCFDIILLAGLVLACWKSLFCRIATHEFSMRGRVDIIAIRLVSLFRFRLHRAPMPFFVCKLFP